MSDLISRQAAIDALTALEEPAPTARHLSAIYDCEDAIKALPSAQPEIIRCKDCKYRYIDEVHGPSCELDTGDPYATGRNADEDNWFCADAERRTNA